MNDDRSPETYVGYDRADNFASPGWIVENEGHVYASASLQLNQWGLSGDWTVTGENAVLSGVGGSIVYRFHMSFSPRTRDRAESISGAIPTSLRPVCEPPAWHLEESFL